MKILIPMFTAIALTTGAVGDVSIANVNKTESYYNERKVVDIDFDKERIENKINKKTYDSSNQNEVYVPGSKNKGIQLNSGKVTIPSSDLKIDKEETITVSLWMKWDGNDNDFIPFAFGEYTLWFHNGNFGFNTGKNDIYGMEKGLKAGQMTHVLAEFHKNDVMKNKLFINGKKQELSQLEGSPDNKKATFDDSLQIGGLKYDNYHDMDEGIILDEFNVLKDSIQDGEEKDLYLLSKVPELNVYQNELYAKSEWAIDILDSDLLYQTDFETNDFIPNFKWGYDEFYGDGGQSITTEDKFSGKQSIRTEDTFKNGNWIQWPNRNRERSINVWERFKFKNGIPLSVTYYAKNNGGTKSLIMANGDGGWAESFYDHDLPPVKLTKPMKRGAKVAHIDNPDAFKVGKHGYTLDQDELKIGAVMQVESVDTENKTVTFRNSDGVDRDVEEGTPFHFRQWRGAWSFPARNVANEEGWKKVSVNTYVTDYKDYDVSKRGGSYYMASLTDKVVYLDNVKFGYATEVELYRDGKKVYKGLMSDFADREAIDKEKPDMVRKITFNGNKDDLSISFDKPKDVGTKYTYNIKGLSKNGETPLSKNKEVEVTAGIKGYSYLIDKNPTTIPSNNVNLAGESLKTSLRESGQYYLHIKTVDNQGNASDTKHIPIEIPTLEAKANHKDNLIELKWSGGKTEPYTYKVFKKKEGEKQFQSVSATDYKKKVKVLNLYPYTASLMKDITFQNWKGENITLPQSALLKKWMEEPNIEDAKGYGKGLIDVDAVELNQFNKNPNEYLKSPDGSWRYDVVYAGAWDTNRQQDLSIQGEQVIEDFINSGRGFLAGHDTITQYHNLKNFVKLSDFLRIKTYPFNGNVYEARASAIQMPWIGSQNIEVKKKGLLTNFPWAIGDIGSKLSVPISHTNSQVSLGDVWMNYSDWKSPFVDKDVGVGPEVSDPETGLGTNNFYLTTWSNTAMIQTGHSNGKATPDEQKVLANTLFYLAQLTSDTKLADRSGQDVDAPTKPNINKAVLNENGTVDVSYNESVDKGTSYEYYVESKGSDTQSVVKSNIAKAEVKTGLKGYSIAIDKNPYTIPDEKTETITASYQLTVPNTKDFYIHVASVDNAGNISEVSHYHYQDKFSPELTITASTKDWTNKTITLHVVATDKDSRVKKIGLPNGQWINGSKAEFIVNENGIYYFKAVDEGGNETIQSIIISNIDKKNPTVQINAPDKWVNTDVKVEIIGNDE
ncbi:LamG domain-containing protein [Bacillus cereus group sp. BfR-BA-01317]|uniref:LamG domain-containing protein n=1 Tax=Bacillus cereus group sp. BfR-BA-01317 TaxID=2920294 RepID=UPI001F55B1BF|nr:LamG domain-containing protein [Bacillus cereus group sp. BfR-BA-01317]